MTTQTWSPFCEVYNSRVSTLSSKTQPISGGSIHGSRLAANKGNNNNLSGAFLAEGNRLHQISFPTIPNQVEWIPSKNEHIPLPVNIGESDSSCILNLKGEVQSVAYSSLEDRVGAIDEFGELHILSNASTTNLQDKHHYKLLPSENSEFNESGWAGVSFHETNPELIATARFFHRDICVYRGDQPETIYSTPQFPTQICFLRSDPNVLVCSEYNHISVWDIRISSKSACIQRIEPTKTQIYALNSSRNGLIIAGGIDRTAFIIDSKKWSLRERWQSCLKYPISFVDFAENQSEFCFVGGVDTEVRCGNWKKKEKRHHGVHVDSRWIGIDKLRNNDDTLVGATMGGKIYIIKDSKEMSRCF